jgi:hypothetical protein
MGITSKLFAAGTAYLVLKVGNMAKPQASRDHQPAKYGSGSPQTPGRRANTLPDSGARAISTAVRVSRAVVMYSTSSFSPPKMQLHGRGTGTSTTRSILPAGV